MNSAKITNTLGEGGHMTFDVDPKRFTSKWYSTLETVPQYHSFVVDNVPDIKQIATGPWLGNILIQNIYNANPMQTNLLYRN
jgi:hypothetical protein